MNILITGFAGSLGGEFTKQLLLKGHSIVGVDNNEWAVASYPTHPRLTKRLEDFRDVTGSFDLIIHCAAYKHIELIEENQDSALENNLIKTRELYTNCQGNILFISTDKSVEPSSFYGETKLEAERETFLNDGIVARLGNILLSSGSVIPKWEKCIQMNLPIPVTDLNMTRYVISVEDAVRQILNLLPKAKHGQVIIPKMKGPVKLSEMVKTVCPKDYPIEVIGLRSGEKMDEKLKWDNEITKYKDDNGEVVERRK